MIEPKKLSIRYIRRANFAGVESSREKLTVKVFLGFEYECPRGHRYPAAGS